MAVLLGAVMAGSAIITLRLSAARAAGDGAPSSAPLLIIGGDSEPSTPVSTTITNGSATSASTPTSVTTTGTATATTAAAKASAGGVPVAAGGTGPVRTVASAGPLPSPPSPPQFGANQPPLNNDSAAAGQLMNYINQVRARAGCGSLVENSSLDAAAVQHSNDMADHNFLSQQGSDGSSSQLRDQRAGYPSPYGENIYQGADARQVIYAWLRDGNARQNLLTCGLRAFGVGVDTQGWYWTADFGQ